MDRVVRSGELSGAVAVVAGSDLSCAQLTGGEVYCWGSNISFQARTAPARIVKRLPDQSITSFTVTGRISAGLYHVCGIEPGGFEPICWGKAAMGNGAGPQTLLYPDAAGRPVSLYNVANPVVLAAAGRDHTRVLRSNGDVMCWGSNTYGELGVGNKTSNWVPTSTTAGAAFWQ